MPTISPVKGCIYCGKLYRKQDFHVCPHCGGDGGGIMQKTWKPTKAQKKAFVKKINPQNN